MSPIILEMVAGDSAPAYTFQCLREDNSIIDLTSSTVKLLIQDPKTRARTNNSANTLVLTNAVQGLATYTWNPTDLPDVGTYRAILQITYPNGKVESRQVRIEASAGV